MMNEIHMGLISKPLLTIVRGVPGSGKSTRARKICESMRDAVHLETDMYMIEDDGEYRWSQDKIGAGHQWCQDETLRNLLEGRNVVVSNTFTRYSEVRPYIDMALDHDFSMRAVIVNEEQDPKVLFERNLHAVPFDTIVRMQDRFDHRPLRDMIEQRIADRNKDKA